MQLTVIKVKNNLVGKIYLIIFVLDSMFTLMPNIQKGEAHNFFYYQECLHACIDQARIAFDVNVAVKPTVTILELSWSNGHGSQFLTP